MDKQGGTNRKGGTPIMPSSTYPTLSDGRFGCRLTRIR